MSLTQTAITVANMNHSHDHVHPPHQHSGGADQSRFLDLDAEVFGDHLAAVLDLSGVATARGIVDLGAGSGAGSRLLRRRYPDAEVTCIDNDTHMLELLRGQGFSTVEADLDNGFPPLTNTRITLDPPAPIDLVWASSSLHHVAQPAQLLEGVREALAPGGVLVVVELATLPSFLTDAREALLEQRCHDAAAAEGWNHHSDWTPVLEAAGFSVTRSAVAFTAAMTPAARTYAEQWFTRFSHLTTLAADDRDAVRDLVQLIPGDLGIEPRATRTVWVATAAQRQEKP
jgi:trans-aconitate methyltransferase